MRVLAIDSSGLTATVAVVEDTQTVAEYTINYKKTHSQTLLPMIDEVVKMTELDLNTIDAIAVAGGPGSFTGLRIGSATAKGLGFALNKPLIHVPTVDGLAYNVYGCEDIICPIMDARRNQVYTGIYTFSKKAGTKEGSNLVEPVFQVIKMQMAVSIEELAERLNRYRRPVVFLGDGVPVYENILAEKLTVPYSFAPAYMNRQRAAVVGTLGIQYYKAGKFETAEEHRPDYVFHAAAYKHVPMMEDNPEESVRNNVDGTRVIADLSVKYGTRKFVMVSTDKAVNPTNVMGCSKRICEIYVQSLDQAIKDGKVRGRTQFVTTRFGNVLGSNGSVIPLFKEQIKRGGPVTVTHKDIIRFFMLIPEACKLVLEAGTMGNGGEIFVFDMGKPVRIVDLAERMIRLSGVKGIEIRFTGLRDGEKLYEEVLNEEETSKPTFHPKIKIAQVRAYDYADANLRIDALVRACAVEGDMQIVKRMKEIVPEFKSQHSKYEVLDK